MCHKELDCPCPALRCRLSSFPFLFLCLWCQASWPPVQLALSCIETPAFFNPLATGRGSLGAATGATGATGASMGGATDASMGGTSVGQSVGGASRMDSGLVGGLLSTLTSGNLTPPTTMQSGLRNSMLSLPWLEKVNNFLNAQQVGGKTVFPMPISTSMRLFSPHEPTWPCVQARGVG